MPTHPRHLVVATATLSLAVGLALGAGAVLAQGQGASAAPSASIPPVGAGAAPRGAPSAGSATVTGFAGGGAAASSAIAYPAFVGTPGVAPDHTIVVTGTGHADMRSDGSDRAAAEKNGLAAALAGAKTQAEAIASATGLDITGVLSVSASVSPYAVVLPMAPEPATPPNVPAPGTATPEAPQVLAVSVTVAYRVG